MNNRITAIFKNFDMKSKGEGFLYFASNLRFYQLEEKPAPYLNL